MAAGGVRGVQRGINGGVADAVGAVAGFFTVFGGGAGGETGFCSIVSCRYATVSATGSVIRAGMPAAVRAFVMCR